MTSNYEFFSKVTRGLSHTDVIVARPDELKKDGFPPAKWMFNVPSESEVEVLKHVENDALKDGYWDIWMALDEKTQRKELWKRRDQFVSWHEDVKKEPIGKPLDAKKSKEKKEKRIKEKKDKKDKKKKDAERRSSSGNMGKSKENGKHKKASRDHSVEKEHSRKKERENGKQEKQERKSRKRKRTEEQDAALLEESIAKGDFKDDNFQVVGSVKRKKLTNKQKLGQVMKEYDDPEKKKDLDMHSAFLKAQGKRDKNHPKALKSVIKQTKRKKNKSKKQWENRVKQLEKEKQEREQVKAHNLKHKRSRGRPGFEGKNRQVVNSYKQLKRLIKKKDQNRF